jgi:hypothetical protein
MVMFHAHVDNSFSEIKVIVHFMKAIIDADFVFGVKSCFDMSPLNLSINNVTKNNLTVSTSTCYCGTVVAPGDAQDGSTKWLIE